MANTPNLDMQMIAAAQAQKEVTSNAAMMIVDTFAGISTVTIANGANALTEAQCQAQTLILTGALTAPATVTIPSMLAKLTDVINLTTGAQSVTVLNFGGTGVVIPYGGNSPVYIGVLQNTGTRPQNSRLVKSVAGGVSVTLTDAESANGLIEFTGAITANINVVVPTPFALYNLANLTSGAFTLTVKTSAGTGVVIATGKRAVCYSDAVNVQRMTADV